MQDISYRRNNKHKANRARVKRKITPGADGKRSIVVPDRSTRVGGPEGGVEGTCWAVLHITLAH
jgi:hypothetical protein